MADQQINIPLYATVPIVSPITTLPVGTHVFRINTSGNSVLSTVFVKAAVGTVLVKYFDFGASNNEDAGARTELGEHATLLANQTDRIIVTRIHNNLRCEVIVSGGSADIAVLGSVVSDFPLNADILDGQNANLLSDGGMPIAVYDETLGKFFLLRGNSGFIATDPEGPGVGKVLNESDILVATGPGVTILSETVPTLKTWRLRFANVVCRGYGRWEIFLDSVRIGGGITGASNEHDNFTFPQGMKALAGQLVELVFTYSYGPASLPIDVFVGITET